MANDTSTSTSTEFVDPHYVGLRRAVAMLNHERVHLLSRAVSEDVVRERTAAIQRLIRSAGASYERCFDCFGRARTLPILRQPSGMVNNNACRHEHRLTRTANFLRLIAVVLDVEVFQTDWPSRLREMIPVAESLDPIRHSKRDMDK